MATSSAAAPASFPLADLQAASSGRLEASLQHPPAWRQLASLLGAAAGLLLALRCLLLALLVA